MLGVHIRLYIRRWVRIGLLGLLASLLPVVQAEEAAPPAKQPEAPRRIHALVLGKVQGVGFRDFTQSAALALGIRGWVRNLPTGEVELEAEGKPEAMKKFEAVIRQGPEWSRVDEVKLEAIEKGDPLPEFERRATPPSRR